jgi:hypothetical protein
MYMCDGLNYEDLRVNIPLGDLEHIAPHSVKNNNIGHLYWSGVWLGVAPKMDTWKSRGY